MAPRKPKKKIQHLVMVIREKQLVNVVVIDKEQRQIVERKNNVSLR